LKNGKRHDYQEQFEQDHSLHGIRFLNFEKIHGGLRGSRIFPDFAIDFCRLRTMRQRQEILAQITRHVGIIPI
jgi:hypothetical protein